mgnify:CR=1 FL=1
MAPLSDSLLRQLGSLGVPDAFQGVGLGLAGLSATTASPPYWAIGGQGIANPGPQSNVQWLKNRVNEICRCWKT